MRVEEIKKRTEKKTRFCFIFNELLSFLRRVRRVALTVAMTLTAVEERPVFLSSSSFLSLEQNHIIHGIGKKKDHIAVSWRKKL